MSRRKTIAAGAVITALIVMYMCYDASVITQPQTFEKFMEMYISSGQKFAFNCTIYGLPTILASTVMICSPEFAVRMKKGLFRYVFINSIKVSSALGIYVIALYTAAGWISVTAPETPAVIVSTAVRLIVYYLQMHMILYAVYILTDRITFAVIVPAALNLSYVVFILSADFISGIRIGMSMDIFMAYILITGLVGASVFCIAAGKHELLPKKME